MNLGVDECSRIIYSSSIAATHQRTTEQDEMTYKEILDTRQDRLLASEKRKDEWFKNVDLDQLENDLYELEEFESLAG